jgi:hypothetical protein
LIVHETAGPGLIELYAGRGSVGGTDEGVAGWPFAASGAALHFAARGKMAEREGFEASPEKSQVADPQKLSDGAASHGTQNGTHASGVACPTLTKVVASWATLPAALRDAIAAIVASHEATTRRPPPTAPEM